MDLKHRAADSHPIRQALTHEDYEAAKTLMIEYRDTALAEDYAVGGCGLNEELEELPGLYGSTGNSLLLAFLNGQPCGCLGLRAIDENVGEVVRMYVKPEARGQGIAERLMRQLIENARAMGYKKLFLDSLKRFTAAHKLYEKLSFTYCAPYSPDTTEAMRALMIFMRLDLKS